MMTITNAFRFFPITVVALCSAVLVLMPMGVYAQDGSDVLVDDAVNVEESNIQDEASEASEDSIEKAVVKVVELKANAGEDRHVAVGRTVFFDASASTIPEDVVVLYRWDFGDGTIVDAIDATHTYTESGTYRVYLEVTIGEGEEAQTVEDSIIVAVQDRIVALIADQSVSKEALEDLEAYALTQGTLIVSILDSGVDQEYLTVQNLAQQILKHEEDILASDIVVTWTSGNVGLNSLIELSRIAALNDTSLERFRFGTKAIVSISAQSLVANAKLAQTAFQSIQPSYIVISNSSILYDVVQAESPGDLQRNLGRVDAPHQLITAYSARGLETLSPWNFMSYAMNYMINKGVPINSLFLILMLPVMATIIAAARQLVGVKAFGIFAPTVIALSFLATGLKYGVTVFVAIIILATIARLIARKLRLLYLPRMAIVLSVLALALFAMFFVGAYLDKTGFVAISIFPILIMTVLSEHFVAVQIEQGYRSAIKLTLETLALSMVGYFIGDWTAFKTLMLAYPELIFVTFIINYFIGKFSGLRVTEYIRFRKVFKQISNAERSK